MIKLKEIFIKERIQYLALSYISIGVMVLTLALCFIDTSPFQRFLGNLNPIVVLAITIVLAFVLLTFLISKTKLLIYKKLNLKDYLIISGIAVIFGIEVIIADIWLVDYSADINILFPKSLLFYPAIGFIVEVFFHLLPISLIIVVLSTFTKLNINKIVWVSIIVVTILEPLYQIWFTSQNSLSTIIYTGIHVLLFSLSQLLIFKRFGFISMYLFRIVFYFIWHIWWGHFRLNFFYT